MDPTDTVAEPAMTEDETAEFEAFRTAFEEPKADDGEKPAPTEAPAPAAAAAPTPPAAPAAPAPPAAPNSGEPAIDPFAGLPKEVRDMLAEVPRLRATLDSQGQELSRWKGQTTALQSKLDKIGSAPTQAPKPARDALRKTLPEIAAALDEVDPIEAAPTPPAAAPVAAAPAAPTPPRDVPESELKANELALDIARPTWFADMDSTDYKLWLGQQPAAKQALVMKTNDAKVIMGSLTEFDAYKSQLASAHETDAARARRIAAGLTPQGDGRRPGKKADPAAGLTPEQIEQQAMDAAFTGKSP